MFWLPQSQSVNWPTRFALLFVTLAGIPVGICQISTALPASGHPSATDALPPEPQPPVFDEKEPKDRETAIKQAIAMQEYRIAHRQWFESLTPIQAALYRSQVKGFALHDGELPRQEEGYAWENAAVADGCSETEYRLLEKNKFVIGKRGFRQSFEVYTNNPYPVFITSDSLLNGFHVLFEDSFRELEIHRTPLLRQNLEIILEEARKLAKEGGYPAADLAPGLRYAQLAVGPALRLLGTRADFFDADVRDEIESQVGKIRAAEITELPKWLGPPSAGLLALDYRRCRPVGFYAGSPHLSDYFRAVRWLQMVPFRASRDTELTAIALLGVATHRATEYFARTGPEYFFLDYERFLGSPDNASVLNAGDEFENDLPAKTRDGSDWAAVLRRKREWLLRPDTPSDDRGRVSDEIRLPIADPDDPPKAQFRVLSAYRVPDAVLFQILVDKGHAPSGMDVAALLGSSWANDRNKANDPGVLSMALQAVREQRERDEHRYGPPLYSEYLDVLSTLFGPPDPDAPAFMHADAWSAKSCQTALASWAQMRHTFTLQTKLTVAFSAGATLPPGFIEPNPTFFLRIAELIERAKAQLKRSDTFIETTLTAAEFLRDKADFIESLKLHLPGATQQALENNPSVDFFQYEDFVDRELEALLPDWQDWFTRYVKTRENPRDFAPFHRDLIVALRKQADRLERGDYQPKRRESQLEERWEKLESVAYRLSAITQKQLRKQPFNAQETDFIKQYGHEIAYIMGYFESPAAQDDAPRWVEVARDPKAEESLAIGAGRPRLIYVLYPWQGTEIFCEGAVMPYYEYHSKERLSDTEWKALLDSPNSPPLPDWIQPYVTK